MSLRFVLRLLVACCLLGVIVPGLLGLTYTDRLAARPSHYLVSVVDRAVFPANLRRPRRVALVVIDGLGHEEARPMRSLARMREHGQCRLMDVGSLPLSRPVYGAMSTGVEQDRGGALINDSIVKHDAESIWDVAHRAGWTVTGVSELEYWRELFPEGFSAYVTAPQSANYFEMAPPSDMVLVHPLYVDEAGHERGAASNEYAAAVARADQEVLGLLGTFDLERDLVVVTSDHGHSLAGGHGGRQERVAQTLTCYAGVGVRRRAEIGTMSVTSLAPSLALLMGLHFPAGMRAGEDDLDVLWDIADEGAFPREHLAERRATVERFRAENEAQLARWVPESHGSWTAFYGAARFRQTLRAIPFIAVLIAILWVHGRVHRRLPRYSRGSRSELWFAMAVLIACMFAAVAIQVGARGSFDMSSIDNRRGFLWFTTSLGVVVGVVIVAAHLYLRRCWRAVVWDMSLLSLVGTLLCVAHPATLGWNLDFPVPAPPVFFFPLFATLFLVGFNFVGLLLPLLVRLARRHPTLSRSA
jgi:hypothetical protein